MKFCLSGREFKAILSKFIEINADTIKFYKNNPAFNRKFRNYKSLDDDIILKLVD